MNRNLLISDDDQADLSFDSSEFCSMESRTATIDSNLVSQPKQLEFMTPCYKKRSIDETLSERTASIEKPRFQPQSTKEIFGQEAPFELGFVIGKNKRNVAFNQSKIKKAKNFFEDDELTFDSNLFPNNSMIDAKPSKPENLQEAIPQFSIPCFKKLGKNQKIEIDQSLIEKAKNFFDDDFDSNIYSNQKLEDLQFPSFNKPTKVKKVSENIYQKEPDFMKTVNANKKKQEVKKAKKQVFDWIKFQISSKKLLLNDGGRDKKQPYRKSTHKKGFPKFSQSIFKAIVLKDLEIEELNDPFKKDIFETRRQYLQDLAFQHEKQKCKVAKCLICDLKIQQKQISMKTLQNTFNSKLIQEKLDHEIFLRLYHQICFKLLKYETFYPQIINKRLNPSNILVQIHKRSKVVQSGTPYLGWLDFCISQCKYYHSFIAEVREICYNEKLNTHFLLLSDGWSNVWTVVTSKNYLFEFIHKLKVCSKLFVGYWKFYPLTNVLTFCPKSRPGQKCIQIWYNSTIIVKENIKLGKPNKMMFYRPLNLNRKEGGLIHTVEGTVIRMFCPLTSKNKTCYLQGQSSFKENFLQIITPEGFCVLIKFILPSDRCLAELFRLYFKYQFYFLKIGSKDNLLQFNDDYSKFYEFEKKDKNVYDTELIQILRKRYMNAMQTTVAANQLKEGSLYDVKIQKNQCLLGGMKVIIENDYDMEMENSMIKPGFVLYQQYRLDRVEKKKSLNFKEGFQFQFYLRKEKYSSILKSLPAIYDKLNQFV